MSECACVYVWKGEYEDMERKKMGIRVRDDIDKQRYLFPRTMKRTKSPTES